MSSQAEELLRSIVDEDAQLGDATLGRMILGMNPYEDLDTHFVVGEDRVITVPLTLRRIAVQHDHDVETVTFDCPRYWDGRDLAKMKIYINGVRADGTPFCWAVDDGVTIDPDNDGIIHFDWVITREVTGANGGLVFLVCAKRVDEDGNEVQHWNSELNEDLYISEGLECVETIISQYPDLITHLLVRMDTVEYMTTLESMLGYLDTYFSTDAGINEVLRKYVSEYLQTDDTVTQTIIDTVDAYIEEHLSVTDKTLTLDGKAADAKVVGEKISALNNHANSKSNPHAVTAAQVGAVTTATFNSHANNKNNPHAVTASQVGAVATATFNSHANNKNNPHAVTASQVGAVDTATFNAHVGNKNNPHGVTAAQIGIIDWFDKGTSISNNADLNTYTTPGMYYASNEATAKTLANCPATENFKMYVFARTSGKSIDQLMFARSKIYIRGTNSDGIWSDWIKLVSENKLSDHTNDTSNPHGVTAAQIGAFPLDGSEALSRRLIIRQEGTEAYTRLYKNVWEGTDYGSELIDYDADGNELTLNVISRSQSDADKRNSCLQLKDKNNVAYPIFSKLNKPSGTYTGNGNAATREIDTKGLGEVIFVGWGENKMALVSNDGAIVKEDTTVTGVNKSEARFYQGKLILNTTNPVLNNNGKTIYWCVL